MAKQNIMKKGASSFVLVGKAKINQYTFDIDKQSQSGYVYSRMNLGIQCEDGNVVYAELMGGYNPNKPYPLYVRGKDANGRDDYKNSFQVDWNNRFDKSIINTVGDRSSTIIGLETDIKGNVAYEKFLSPYDAINYAKDNLENDMVVYVTGELEYSYYNDSVTMKKKITKIGLSNATPDLFKAKFTQSFLLDSDSISKQRDESKNSIEIKGHVVEYINKLDGVEIKQLVALPKSFEISLDRYNDAEKLKLLLDLYFKTKKDWYSELTIEGFFKEGVSVGAGSIDDLDPDLRNLVLIGSISEEQAIAKTMITGSREKRMLFETPLVVSTEKNGVKNTEIKYTPEKYRADEVVFLDDVYGQTEVQPSKSEPIQSIDDDDDDEDDIPIDLNAFFK